MRLNTDMTVLHQSDDGVFTQDYIPACMWQEDYGRQRQKYGDEQADRATVWAEGAVNVHEGDLIVKGTVAPGGEQTAAQSALRVTSVSHKDYAPTLMHTRIGAI